MVDKALRSASRLRSCITARAKFTISRKQLGVAVEPHRRGRHGGRRYPRRGGGSRAGVAARRARERRDARARPGRRGAGGDDAAAVEGRPVPALHPRDAGEVPAAAREPAAAEWCRRAGTRASARASARSSRRSGRGRRPRRTCAFGPCQENVALQPARAPLQQLLRVLAAPVGRVGVGDEAAVADEGPDPAAAGSTGRTSASCGSAGLDERVEQRMLGSVRGQPNQNGEGLSLPQPKYPRGTSKVQQSDRTTIQGIHGTCWGLRQGQLAQRMPRR